MTRWSRSACAVAALALAAAACASAEKRLQQGMTLEQRGRPADAARRYIDALEKEPALPGARERLQIAADRAGAEALAEADVLESAGRPGSAANVLLELDGLRGAVARLQMRIALPADYADRKRATFDRAIAGAITYAEGVGRLPDFPAAARGLESAMRYWQPSAEQREAMDQALAATQLRWADGELGAAHFRAAYDRAGAVARRSGPEADVAAALQAEALRLGTVRAAVMPVGADAGVRDRLPADLLPALNDELETNRWNRPPAFVDVVDSRVVRGSARHHGARFVVEPQVDSVWVTESDVRESHPSVSGRPGAIASYTVREGRRTIRVQLSYRMVDADNRGTPVTGTLSASSSQDFREGAYTGDVRDAPPSARELLDPRRRDRDRRRLIGELSARLATELERQVYDRLSQEVQ